MLYRKYVQKTAIYLPNWGAVLLFILTLRLGNENESFLTFILHCARLALSLDKIGCGSAMKMKVF